MAAIESLTAEAIIAMINQGTWPQEFPVQTIDVNSAGSVGYFDVSDAANVILHLKNAGSATMAAGIHVFEASIDSTDGTDGTWFAVQAARTNDSTIETNRNQTMTPTLVAGASSAYAWEISVNAFKWFRIRCTTSVTASSVARWVVNRTAFGSEPGPSVQGTVSIAGTVPVTPGTGTQAYQVGTASTNALVVKASPGNLMEISLFNPTAALVYLKIYDKATAPTVGTNVPVLTIPVAVNSMVSLNFGSTGKRFTAGIGTAITAGPLATDTAAVAVGTQLSATFI